MKKEQVEAGEQFCETYMGRRPSKGKAVVSGDLYDLTLGHVFGEIWQRGGISTKERSLITCALLAAAGKEDELRIHVHGALNIGVSRDAIREVMIHTAHYSGWPCGVGGTRVAEAVFSKLDERETSA